MNNAEFDKWWRDDGFELFDGDLRNAARAAYEAGGIAMKEKAAAVAKQYSTIGVTRRIRELPLSGAEEAKTR